LGLNKIKNIGNKDANKILSCGKNFDKVRRECKSQYPVLVECGYFDEKESNRRHLFQKKELQENTLFRWAENKEELKDADWSEEEKLSRLRKYIPWPRGKEELKATKFDDLVKTVDSINGETLDNSAFLVKGWVTEVKVYNNNWGKSLDLVFDDGSSQIKLTAYSYIYEKNNKLLDSIIAGDYNLSVICAVHPFYLQRGNSISKEGKLNLLWIDKITSEVPENILKGLKKDEIELSDREYLVTNISYGTSKKGNKYAAVETCDKDDKIWSGIVMIKSDIAPQYGWIIKGSWSEPNGGFFRGDYN
jgi:DNA polymerase III alpha subunit